MKYIDPYSKILELTKNLYVKHQKMDGGYLVDTMVNFYKRELATAKSGINTWGEKTSDLHCGELAKKEKKICQQQAKIYRAIIKGINSIQR